jgi:hypothetical protein
MNSSSSFSTSSSSLAWLLGILSNKLLPQQEFRDRGLRLGQYFCKLLGGILVEGDGAEQARRMELALLSSRQFYRLFKSIGNILAIHSIMVQQQQHNSSSSNSSGSSSSSSSAKHASLVRFEKHMQIAQQLAYAFFFIVDHAVLLTKTRVILQGDPTYMRQVASASWTLSSVSGLVMRLSQLFRLSEIETESGSGEGTTTTTTTTTTATSAQMKAVRTELTLDAIRNLLDIHVGWGLSRYEKFTTIQQKTLGLCGVVGASIQCWQIYQTAALGVPLSQRLALPVNRVDEESDKKDD